MNKKISDILTAGLLMSLAWTLRGQFGHLKGAMIPGAAAAILAATLGRDESWRSTFGRAAIFSAVGFSLGGHFSYGKLIEQILASPFLTPGPLARIFMIGFLWGGLGASFLGFGLSEKSFRFADCLLFGFLGLFWFIPLGILNLESLDALLYAAGLIFLHFYNFTVKKSLAVFLWGLFGALGFGLAFLFSVLVLWAGNQGFFPTGFAFWVLRDQLWGFFGGMSFLFSLRLLERFECLPAGGQEFPNLEKAGYLFLIVLLPAFLTAHVVIYWIKIQTPLLATRKFIALGAGTVFLFLILGWAWLGLKKQLLFQRERIFALSSLLFLWYLIFLATGKEVLIFGHERWEDAYTIFIVSGVFLTGLIPFKVYSNLKR